MFVSKKLNKLTCKQTSKDKQTNKQTPQNKTKQQQKQHNLHKISCNIQLLISSFVWFAVDHTQVSGCSKDWACAPGSWQGKSLYMILYSLLEFLSLHLVQICFFFFFFFFYTLSTKNIIIVKTDTRSLCYEYIL